MGCLNTTLCYIEQQGRYLMLHRTKKQGDPNAGKWVGIGGKFEDGESPEDCVRREVLEETGLTLTAPLLRGIITFVSDCFPTEYMFLFTAEAVCSTLSLCDEGELAWIEKDRLFSLPLWAGDRIFLSLLQERMAFFSLKLCYCGEALTAAFLDGKALPLPEETD